MGEDFKTKARKIPQKLGIPKRSALPEYISTEMINYKNISKLSLILNQQKHLQEGDRFRRLLQFQLTSKKVPRAMSKMIPRAM